MCQSSNGSILLRISWQSFQITDTHYILLKGKPTCNKYLIEKVLGKVFLSTHMMVYHVYQEDVLYHINMIYI